MGSLTTATAFKVPFASTIRFYWEFEVVFVRLFGRVKTFENFVGMVHIRVVIIVDQLPKEVLIILTVIPVG